MGTNWGEDGHQPSTASSAFSVKRIDDTVEDFRAFPTSDSDIGIANAIYTPSTHPILSLGSYVQRCSDERISSRPQVDPPVEENPYSNDFKLFRD